MKADENLVKCNLLDKGKLFDDVWSPKIVGELNHQQVKLAKFLGEFGWHHHVHEDELFLVLEGQIEIRLRGQTVVLNPGEFLIVPKGVEHNPYAKEKSLVMLFEPGTTLNTGNVQNEKTKAQLSRI